MISSGGALQPTPSYTEPAGLNPPNVAGFECNDVFGNSARMNWVGNIASAIQGGWFGIAADDPLNNYPWSYINGFPCGGDVCVGYPNCQPTSGMIKLTTGHTAPDILDIHTYPTVSPPAPPNPPADPKITYTDDGYGHVLTEAITDFNDLPGFLNAIGTPSALLMIGETHSNTTADPSTMSQCGQQPGGGTPPVGSCECHPAPSTAASETVSGYNSSLSAGRSGGVVFRPWSDIQAACYSWPTPFANQLINTNNAGPYTPAQEQ